jgi:hypothetical protein
LYIKNYIAIKWIYKVTRRRIAHYSHLTAGPAVEWGRTRKKGLLKEWGFARKKKAPIPMEPLE